MKFLQASGFPLHGGSCNVFSKRFDVVSLRRDGGKIVFHQNSSIEISDGDSRLTRPMVYYVKLDWIGNFVRNILPMLRNPIILVTACSDMTPQHCFPKETQLLLQSSLICQWWAENNDIVGSEKVHSLPCGLGSCHSLKNTGWEMLEREEFLLTLRKNIISSVTKKHNRILCRWRPRIKNVAGANKVERGRATQWAQSSAAQDLCDVITEELDGKRYLELVHEYAFILCPNGNGIDPSPRVWEALVLGTVPIIKSSTLDDAYSRLPCLIVRDWEDITPELLNEKGKELLREVLDENILYKLSMDFWENLILS